MNREILFRGQTRKKGEKVKMNGTPVDGNWVYGGVAQGKGDFSIIYSYEPIEKYVVHSDTLGQFTGLTDKNGTRIFEGDVVVTRHSDGKICSIGDVQFSHGVFGAEWVSSKENKSLLGSWGQLHNLRRFDDSDMASRIEVIGNIHDNTELLEVAHG